MEERLETVINKIILPHYPSIVKFVVEPVRFREPAYNFYFTKKILRTLRSYKVIYWFDNEKDMNKQFPGIAQQTEAIFEMLGPEDDEIIDIMPEQI